MTDSAAGVDLRAVVTRIEPAARLVPARALRRAIRRNRERDGLGTRAVHDRAWWVRTEDLFRALTPLELGLAPGESAPELLLLPAPADGEPPPTRATLWRTLFHAAADREVDRAIRDGRLSDDSVRSARRRLGPARWHAVRALLEEENLIGHRDPDSAAFREFVAFALEVLYFAPAAWNAYFPGLSPDAPPFVEARRLINADALRDRTRPTEFPGAPAPPTQEPDNGPLVPVRVELTEAGRRRLAAWTAQGNDLAAAILLHQVGDDWGVHTGRLLNRLTALLDLTPEQAAHWQSVLNELLPRAAAGDWPPERRLLYELQAACLAVERPTYSSNLVEWARTFGRRPLKRPLTKPRWPNAARHLRAAGRHAERLPAGPDVGLSHLIEAAVRAAEGKARADLRPEIVATLDEVGLVPRSLPERLARDKVVEELLDGACARGFLRIGDLRDAVARNRLKLPDLRGAGELVRGDPIIRADRRLAVRLDGVYRRGEVYMRLLQRGCSVFFGTPVGRWLTKYVALPFGGAFLLLEAFHHLVEAGEDFVDWVTGWDDTVQGLAALAGSAAGYVADNPNPPRGVNWPVLLALGLFLLLMIHWPGFRRQVTRLAKLVFVKVPRAVRRSPAVRAIVFNPVTRLVRRYLLLPLVAGGLTAAAVLRVSGDWTSAALVGSGVALLLGTFFRTPLGRMVEDQLDEAAERFWRVVSVNFVMGVLTLILHFFRAVFDAIDRGIYVVDEWLRFREGESRMTIGFKLLFGAVWGILTYVFRFAWNLLVEPQINPIKHFPVVTVSHKMLLPLIPSLAKEFGVGEGTMATIVFGVPGIFGFLVWELKENWKLYAANAPGAIRPVAVGSHGERVRGLLRPGFHSGVVPKTFTKLRRAVRGGNLRRAARHRHTLEHVAEAVLHFAARDFVAYLRASRRWGGAPVGIGASELAPNGIRLPLDLAGDPAATAVLLEERGGWVIASVETAGELNRLTPDQRAAFEDALIGLYKRAGVHAVREQVARVFGPQAYQFDAVPEGLIIPLPDGSQQFFDYEDGPELWAPMCELPTGEVVLSGRPLPWAEWVERWEADAAGKSPRGPLVAGWTFLPDPGTPETSPP